MSRFLRPSGFGESFLRLISTVTRVTMLNQIRRYDVCMNFAAVTLAILVFAALCAFAVFVLSRRCCCIYQLMKVNVGSESDNNL